MTTTRETTGERLARIRKQSVRNPANDPNDYHVPPNLEDTEWLCDKLQGALDELETVDRALIQLRRAMRELRASMGWTDG